MLKSRSGLNYEIMSAKSRNQEFLKSRNQKVFLSDEIEKWSELWL